MKLNLSAAPLDAPSLHSLFQHASLSRLDYLEDPMRCQTIKCGLRHYCCRMHA